MPVSLSGHTEGHNTSIPSRVAGACHILSQGCMTAAGMGGESVHGLKFPVSSCFSHLTASPGLWNPSYPMML